MLLFTDSRIFSRTGIFRRFSLFIIKFAGRHFYKRANRAAKLGWAGGGAQRPVLHVNEPKKTNVRSTHRRSKTHKWVMFTIGKIMLNCCFRLHTHSATQDWNSLTVVQLLALPGNCEINKKKICRKHLFSCVCSLMNHGRVMNVVGKMYLCTIWYHSCAMPDSPYIDKLDILVR
jgi:hypothetical protein